MAEISGVIYPEPRWFRETVLDWLRDTPIDQRHHRLAQLFTNLVNAQPPGMHLVQSKANETLRGCDHPAGHCIEACDRWPNCQPDSENAGVGGQDVRSVEGTQRGDGHE